MCRGLLNFVHIYQDPFLQYSLWCIRRAPSNGIPPFGTQWRIIPALTRREYDSFPLPLFLQCTGARCANGTAAVGKEGNIKCHTWIQVAANEEVTVVQCCSM